MIFGIMQIVACIVVAILLLHRIIQTIGYDLLVAWLRKILPTFGGGGN